MMLYINRHFLFTLILAQNWIQLHLKHSTMLSSFTVRSILVFGIFIFHTDSKRHGIREGQRPEQRDYRPSKWVANSAMDVWYGNKSTIDIISREFNDIMYKLMSRPVRSVPPYKSENDDVDGNNDDIKLQLPSKQVSRVEINFINADNNTVHTIKLQPMKQVTNHTVFKVLEPLIEMPDY